MSPLGAGFLRLWTEKQIAEGRKINAAALARESSVDGGTVQAGAPWSVVLGGKVHSPLELARMLVYLGCPNSEEAEEIGSELVRLT